MRLLFLSLIVLLLGAQAASAETRSVAYATWNVTGGEVRVRYAMPERQTADLVARGLPAPTTKEVADYVLKHLAVLRQGKACEVVDQGQDLGLISTMAFTPGMLRFEVVFRCMDGQGLTLQDTAFADRLAGHVDYARVNVDDTGFVEHMFTAAAPQMALAGPGKMPAAESVLSYARLGFFHVLDSAEILCFLAAILLVARRRCDFYLALGALAIGYTGAALLSAFHLAGARFADDFAVPGLLILLAAAVGVVLALREPRRGIWALAGCGLVLALSAYVLRGEPAGLTIAGVVALASAALFAGTPANARSVFLVAAPLLFALVDGFAIGADVAPLDLAPDRLAPMVAGFNAAALFGIAVLALCLVGLRFLVPALRRLTRAGAFLPDAASAVLAGLGLFWVASWLLAAAA